MTEFLFKNASGVVFKAKAINSDLALDLCCKETGWKFGQIVYLGKASDVDAEDLSLLNEIKRTPGRVF